MAYSAISPGGYPSPSKTIAAKAPSGYPSAGLLVEEFDIWREGYDGAQVNIFKAGTTELLPLYSDLYLTTPLDNPQILTTKVDAAGRRYGKFATNVYVPYAYYLDIDNEQQTGAQRLPITQLAGEDASAATVKATGGSTNRTLADRAAEIINLKDYGTITTSPTTNTATLNSAIGAASNAGGGTVVLPAGTIPILSVTLPSKVCLRGQGKGVTVLQSQLADRVITVSDDSALEDMTLDGVSVLNNSVGIYGVGADRLNLNNVEVKRFQVGVFHRGGREHNYSNFDVTGCQVNFRARGDLDTTVASAGDEFSGLVWDGGVVSTSTLIGIELYVNDKKVANNLLRRVKLSENVGADGAIYLYGAQRTLLDDCIFSSNTLNINVKDNPNTAIAEKDRQVSGLHFYGGHASSGSFKFDGLCDDVQIKGMNLESVTFNLLTPTNNIVLDDCREISTTISGEATKFLRHESRTFGTARVSTTGATTTTIARIRLAPNRIALLDVKAIGERVNGTDFGVMHTVHAARGAVATLAYDNQTANYTAGNNIVGQTSGATATIIADSDSGTTGTLSLGNVSGTFIDNEIIAESNGSGSAQANGVLVEGSAALIGAATAVHSAGSNAGALPASWALGFAVVGQEVLITVTGAASNTIQWDAKVDVVYRG
jgi:hypothetical protein